MKGPQSLVLRELVREGGGTHWLVHRGEVC